MAMPVVLARGLTKSFPGALPWRRREVLRGVDLEVESGGALGLVGPNGSGKSTLLRILAGVERPGAGDVRVLGGRPVEAAVRRGVGFLPEDSPFPGELTAPATLELLGALAGAPRRERRARAGELLERVGLAAHRRTPLGRYSRGMLRRFGLAQALLLEPALLLLDEPTAGLDAPGHELLGDLLDEARVAGATLVLSTHVLGDLAGHCDRVAVLLGGRVAATGTPEELADREDSIEWELSGSAEARAAAERALEDGGGRILARRPPPGLLRKLYRRGGGA
jgi:ABC-type multidrug transport system ATPase subunit